jgi:hypothetical protein
MAEEPLKDGPSYNEQRWRHRSRGASALARAFWVGKFRRCSCSVLA